VAPVLIAVERAESGVFSRRVKKTINRNCTLLDYRGRDAWSDDECEWRGMVAAIMVHHVSDRVFLYCKSKNDPRVSENSESDFVAGHSQRR